MPGSLSLFHQSLGVFPTSRVISADEGFGCFLTLSRYSSTGFIRTALTRALHVKKHVKIA